MHLNVGLHGRGLLGLPEADEELVVPSPVPFFLAKCLPSWPPSPEIRTARAKFTDFLLAVSDFSLSGQRLQRTPEKEDGFIGRREK